jgi:hypothetical protein
MESIWATDSMRFGIFMLCYGIVFGAIITFGVMKYQIRKKVNELSRDPSP